MVSIDLWKTSWTDVRKQNVLIRDYTVFDLLAFPAGNGAGTS